MHLSIEFLHFSNGSGAPDGWRDVKRLDWLSVVECLRGRYIYSCNGSPAVTINPGEAFIAPAGALQDILHRTDKDGIFECRYVLSTPYATARAASTSCIPFRASCRTDFRRLCTTVCCA